MNLQTGDQTFVSRLRVRRSALDPLQARLRLNTLFQAADLQPASISPAAIVCIRRLNDPRPRTVSLARGNTHLPPEWQESVRASIEHLARRAPHPAREYVGADEQCVVFADRAELLAALADDWCAHRAMTRWWWQSLFKETINSGRLVKLWQDSPEYVPGALEHLARRAHATRFVAALAEASARAILHSLTRRFALSRLEAALSAAPHVEPKQPDEEPPLLESSRPDRLTENTRLATREFDAGEAPWRNIVPESHADDLPLAQQCLLGVGLVLQRAPALARSISFAHRVNAWLNSRAPSDQPANARASSAARTKEPHDARSAPQIDSAPQPLAAPTRDASDEHVDSNAPSPISDLAVVQNSHAPQVSGAGVEPSQSRDERESALGDARESASLSKTVPAHDVARAVRSDAVEVAASDAGLLASIVESGDAGVNGVELEREDSERVSLVTATETQVELPEIHESSLASITESEAMAEARPALIAHVETCYGGLFHLVNLSLFLELYGDFTSPSEPGIALPIWDFVALLGRRLCGAGVETDPVWPLLAELAGRGEAQAPGADFAPPDEWRVPVGWLRVFPQGAAWTWTTTQDAQAQTRLQIIHPAKFLLLDVPLDKEAGAERQLARELEVYAAAFDGKLERAARPYKTRGRTSLARWVERLHAFVRARLRRALGTSDARRAARLVCERRASVFVTTTHVDIVMRLAELPFEVRVAGLDRDPGWVPAAGRFVAFHFE
jgi:hypothetical protein